MNCIRAHRNRLAEQIAGLKLLLEEASEKFTRLVAEAHKKGFQVTLPHDGTYLRLCEDIAQGMICPPRDPDWQQALAYSWTLLARGMAAPLQNPELVVELIHDIVIRQSGIALEYGHYREAQRWNASVDLAELAGNSIHAAHAECSRMWVLREPTNGDLRADYPADILQVLCSETRATWWLKFAGLFDFDTLAACWDDAAGILVRGKSNETQIVLVRQRIKEINAELAASAS